MPLIYLDDLRLNLAITGPVDGPPLVLIHALGTNLTLWDSLLPLLPAGLRVLRYDHRGHGQSDVPPPPYAMGALIRDAERVMEHAGMRDAVVLGSSLGGLVAQGLATKRLDLVRGLILSNTAARIGNAAMWQDRIATFRAQGAEGYADSAMERMFGRNFRTVAGMPRLRAMLTSTAPDGWIGCATAISGADFYATTANLTLPTMVIAGSNDGTTPPDMVRETADLILGASFHLIRGTGHFPFIEQPETYAKLIGDFLKAIGHI
ncbi:MAG: alpha/beta fold hydrolase [Paracoccaceae bacterium]